MQHQQRPPLPSIAERPLTRTQLRLQSTSRIQQLATGAWRMRFEPDFAIDLGFPVPGVFSHKITKKWYQK